MAFAAVRSKAVIMLSLIHCFSYLVPGVFSCWTRFVVRFLGSVIVLAIYPCTEPESFVREGRTSTTFFFLVFDYFDEGSKYHYKRAIIGPPAKCHLNGVL